MPVSYPKWLFFVLDLDDDGSKACLTVAGGVDLAVSDGEDRLAPVDVAPGGDLDVVINAGVDPAGPDAGVSF